MHGRERKTVPTAAVDEMKLDQFDTNEEVRTELLSPKGDDSRMNWLEYIKKDIGLPKGRISGGEIYEEILEFCLSQAKNVPLLMSASRVATLSVLWSMDVDGQRLESMLNSLLNRWKSKERVETLLLACVICLIGTEENVPSKLVEGLLREHVKPKIHAEAERILAEQSGEIEGEHVVSSGGGGGGGGGRSGSGGVGNVFVPMGSTSRSRNAAAEEPQSATSGGSSGRSTSSRSARRGEEYGGAFGGNGTDVGSGGGGGGGSSSSYSSSSTDGGDSDGDDSSTYLIEYLESWQACISLIIDQSSDRVKAEIKDMFDDLLILLDHSNDSVRVTVADCLLLVVDAAERNDVDVDAGGDIDINEAVKTMSRIAHDPEMDWGDGTSRKSFEFVTSLIKERDVAVLLDLITISGAPSKGASTSQADFRHIVANSNRKGHPVTGFADACLISYFHSHLGAHFADLFSLSDLHSNRSNSRTFGALKHILSRHPSSKSAAVHIEGLRTFGSSGPYRPGRYFLSDSSYPSSRRHRKVRVADYI